MSPFVHDHLRSVGRAVVLGVALALALAAPVLARADPPPPWGDVRLLALAISMVALSLMLSLTTWWRGHRAP